MGEVTFADLVLVYENTDFDGDGRSGTLKIVDEGVLRAIRLCEDNDAAAVAGITVLDDAAGLAVGQRVGVFCDSPRVSLGILAKDLDALLSWPSSRLAEPDAYYVIDGRYGRSTQPIPAELVAYREVLQLIELFGEAAAFLDPTRRQLMFLKDGRVPVPILYDAATVRSFPRADAAELRSLFSEDGHRDQKLAILADAVTALASAQPQGDRFRFLLRNVATVLTQVRAGYRLFASEFSYEKIRSDIEDARLDYLGKIHKTFIDIQGQLLGLPVATVVVASQLKAASSCGVELWTDVAVLFGAWVFVVLLFVAVGNQLLTLDAIAEEVSRQKRKMEQDYAAVSEQFTDVFNGLERRVRWHRRGLRAVSMVVIVGALFATLAFVKLVDVNPWSCVVGSRASGSTVVSPPAGSQVQVQVLPESSAPTSHAGQTQGQHIPRRDE